MKKLSRRFVVATAFTLPTFFALAGEAPSNAVIVTATRTAQTADETLAPVTVITKEDIERSQSKTVADLISGLAGINTSINGGSGKATRIFLRGTNEDHVLVLIDGVRIGSATSGTASWQHLPVDQIDRIEIVRGPRSSLYGADAIGGVIQIFTRKGTSGFHAGATAGYGSHDSREYSANASGGDGKFHYSVSSSRLETDGINARTVTTGTNEPDDDGYSNDSYSTRIGYRIDDRTEMQAYLLRVDGRTFFDGSTNETDFEQDVYGADFRFAPTNIWNTKVQIGSNHDYNDNFKDGRYLSTINTKRRTQSWQNDITIASQQLLTVGIDHQTDVVKNINSSGVSQLSITSRDNTGYFMQHQIDMKKHDLILGLRRDDNEAFGTNDTGNLAWGYGLVPDRLRFVASYGTAFKAPTFNQLYFPGFGNPDVKPESSESVEFSLKGKEDTGTWDIRAYQTDIDNLIVNTCIASCGTSSAVLRPENVNRARIRGLETEASIQAEKNRTTFNLTFLDPRDANTDKLLPRRAKRILRIDTEFTISRWRLGTEWLTQSDAYDDAANAIHLGGYGLINFHAQYDISKNWYVRAKVDNLFDKEYQTAATFNSLGRIYFLTLGYQMQ